jgi:hypothetical protein
MTRHMKLRGFGAVGAAVLVVWVPSPTRAAIIETDTGPSAGTFAVSSSDLINGLTPASTGNFGPTSGDAFAAVAPAVLSDGQFGAANPNTESAANNNRSTVAIQNGATVTYSLDTSVNTLGYRITSISTYAGWQDNGRDNQNYTVSYSTVASPTTFLPITTVNYNPGGTLSPSNDFVQLTDTTGALATNVKAIQFSFASEENGYAGYREFDVAGTAVSVPEPGSAGLLCAAAAGVLARRRRNA